MFNRKVILLKKIELHNVISFIKKVIELRF